MSGKISQPNKIFSQTIAPQEIGASFTVKNNFWSQILGFSPKEIPVLLSEGILKPLGRPARNGPKYFATAELKDLRRNPKWLAKASDVIVDYWKGRNSKKIPTQKLKAFPRSSFYLGRLLVFQINKKI